MQVRSTHAKISTDSMAHFYTEFDFTFPTAARQKAKLILAEVQATYQIQVFSGVEHGFATRGDKKVESIRRCRNHCLVSVINFALRIYRLGR